MSTRYDEYESTESYEDLREPAPADREISLGTATVLGIFLGLALVCALFFAFGYSMGRKSVPSALANVSTDVSSPLAEGRSGTDTTPNGNVGSSAYVPPVERTESRTVDSASGARAPEGQRTRPSPTVTVSQEGPPSSVESAQRQQVARAVQQANGAPTDTTKAPAAGKTAAPPVVSGGTVYVQVTAISAAHRGDAEMLVNSLKRKGYAAVIYPGAADDLLHVQLGPFATKKDAETMRQRLSADGYNSILK